MSRRGVETAAIDGRTKMADRAAAQFITMMSSLVIDEVVEATTEKEAGRTVKAVSVYCRHHMLLL